MKYTLLVLAGLAHAASHAATFHVSTTGDDANNGLTPATAWATLQHAADVAEAGDSVLVQPGDYQGFAAMDHSGTENAPIVFLAAAPGVQITSPCSFNDLDGINVENVSWVVIEGFTVNNMPRTGIRTALSDHVTIRSNTCDGNGKWGILTGFAEHVVIEYNTCSGSVDEHGIYHSNSADDPIIRYNHCFDNNASGIHMNGDVSMGGDGVISNAQVYGNVIHGNGVAGGSGINCDGVAQSQFYNNLLYDNHASGISLYRIDGGSPSVGNLVYNNTIINASDARWCVNITEDCAGNSLLNNILINEHPSRGSIVVAASAFLGFVSSYNLVTPRLSPDGDATILDLAGWQALGYDLNSQVADAQNLLFVAPGSDFHPVDANAQMVDAGTNGVSFWVATDLDGVVRPQGATHDIGCYEYMGTTGLGAPRSSSVAITVQGHELVVAGQAAGARLAITDAAGRLVLERQLAVQMDRMAVPMRGVFVVRVQDAGGMPLAARTVVIP